MRNTYVPDMTEKFPEDEAYEDDVYEETGNAPCDNSGFCAGSSCKYFYQCQK